MSFIKKNGSFLLVATGAVLMVAILMGRSRLHDWLNGYGIAILVPTVVNIVLLLSLLIILIGVVWYVLSQRRQ